MMQHLGHFIAHFIATVSYAGCLPKAPGTWGSLVAIPLYYILPRSVFIMSIPLLFIVGWMVTYVLLKHDPSDKDPSHIVIDELYAMMLVFVCIPENWVDSDGLYPLMALGFAFALFRFFDIVKPWPIHTIDFYFKKRGALGASFGVMIDDFVAALFSIAVMEAFRIAGAFQASYF